MRGFVYEMKHDTELVLIMVHDVSSCSYQRACSVGHCITHIDLLSLTFHRHTNTRSFMQPIKRFMVGAFVPFTVAGVQIFGGGVYAVMTRVSLNMG